MELDLTLAARRAAASMSHPMEWPTLKPAISMTTKRHMCARLLPLPRHFLHRPLEPGTLRARSFGSQGGGLYISGTATLTNTNVYSNQAAGVCSPSALAQTFPPSPRWCADRCYVWCVAERELFRKSNPCVAFHRPAGSCITYLSSAGSAITTVLEAPSKPTGAVEAPMCAPV